MKAIWNGEILAESEMTEEDLVLVGFDLKKDLRVILTAYDAPLFL